MSLQFQFLYTVSLQSFLKSVFLAWLVVKSHARAVGTIQDITRYYQERAPSTPVCIHNHLSTKIIVTTSIPPFTTLAVKEREYYLAENHLNPKACWRQDRS